MKIMVTKMLLWYAVVIDEGRVYQAGKVKTVFGNDTLSVPCVKSSPLTLVAAVQIISVIIKNGELMPLQRLCARRRRHTERNTNILVITQRHFVHSGEEGFCS